MSNGHHVEPPTHPERPHDPEPHGDPEPIKRDEWGPSLLRTNTFRPREDPSVVHDLARRAIEAPAPDPDRGETAEMRQLRQAGERLTRLADGLRPSADIDYSWESCQASAYTNRACLPEFWRDTTAAVRDSLARIEDKAQRQASEKAFGDALKGESDILKRLAEWEAKRREYPLDWNALSGLQGRLNDQLINLMAGLKAMPAEIGGRASEAGMVIQMKFSSIVAELGRQAAELVDTTTPDRGSACEAIADTFAADTAQNKEVETLVTQKYGLAYFKLGTQDASGAVRDRWEKEREDPFAKDYKAWKTATGGKQQDYQKVSDTTRELLAESFDMRNALEAGEFHLAEGRQEELLDSLSVIADAVSFRLRELRDAADLQHQGELEKLIDGVATLREPTQTEKLAQQAQDTGLAEFWSKAKKDALDKIEKGVVDGAKLKAQLVDRLNEDLGSKLGKWTDAVKKAPNHDEQAAREAAWELRMALRRYYEKIEGLSPKPEYQQRAKKLLLALDALQVAVSNRIRQGIVDGYLLF